MPARKDEEMFDEYKRKVSVSLDCSRVACFFVLAHHSAFQDLMSTNYEFNVDALRVDVCSVGQGSMVCTTKLADMSGWFNFRVKGEEYKPKDAHHIVPGSPYPAYGRKAYKTAETT